MRINPWSPLITRNHHEIALKSEQSEAVTGKMAFILKKLDSDLRDIEEAIETARENIKLDLDEATRMYFSNMFKQFCTAKRELLKIRGKWLGEEPPKEEPRRTLKKGKTMDNRAGKSYWQRFRAERLNGCDVGIATTIQYAEQYRTEGYIKIPRDTAIRVMKMHGESDSPVHIDLTLDGHQPAFDRFRMARLLKDPHAQHDRIDTQLSAA
jgi:hypothetical protein